jgi:murein L,D-transpeptidase YcbB/YkuD
LIDRTSGQLETMSFRTINGRTERKTPSMKDKITHLIFNPFWTVPPIVFIQDKVALIKGLDYWGMLNYFDTNNFIVVDDRDRQIDPGSIDWGNIHSSNVNFYIKQLPNYFNALGVVKFMMTNPYAIYLHDTNERERFVEDNRLISSGCVRLQYPLDFAEYLLRGTTWDRARIEDFVVRPGEVLNKETQVNLKTTLPVYLMSITSQITSDGILRFTEDVYGHNAKMLNSIQAMGK